MTSAYACVGRMASCRSVIFLACLQWGSILTEIKGSIICSFSLSFNSSSRQDYIVLLINPLYSNGFFHLIGYNKTLGMVHCIY